MTNKFDSLWSNYPKAGGAFPGQGISREKLFREILQGGWGDILDDPEKEKNYRNTCAIRLSVAFNKAGLPVPADLARQDGGHLDGDGAHIIIKVPTAEMLLKKYFGEPRWGISKNPGSPFPISQIPQAKVLLLYRVNWSDAFGHVDLWNGSVCGLACDNDDVKQAHQVAIWKSQLSS